MVLKRIDEKHVNVDITKSAVSEPAAVESAASEPAVSESTELTKQVSPEEHSQIKK